MMTDKLKIGYLKWRCRRGTKELDVLLNRFLDLQYASMTIKEVSDFDEMLNAQDTTLWYWIIGKETPPVQAITELALKINKK